MNDDIKRRLVLINGKTRSIPVNGEDWDDEAPVGGGTGVLHKKLAKLELELLQIHREMETKLETNPSRSELVYFIDRMMPRILDLAYYAGSKILNLPIEYELKDDGRWIIAEIPALPGCMTYGTTQDEAKRNVQALALAILASRLQHGERGLRHEEP